MATAAAGALVGAPGGVASAGTATTAAGSGPAQLDRAPLLSAETIAAALALRSQETVERSTQRDVLGQTVADAAAAQALVDQATLDALAGARLERFADAPPVWVVPVSGYRLTSLYGPRWGRSHTGLDMAAPIGTPILAMSDGEIISARYEGGYGNKTVVRHPDGTETWYCHQTRFELTSGTVAAGQLIGYVGSTGNSTGPHLHLEVHPGGGGPINPLTWMRDVLGLTV